MAAQENNSKLQSTKSNHLPYTPSEDVNSETSNEGVNDLKATVKTNTSVALVENKDTDIIRLKYRIYSDIISEPKLASIIVGDECATGYVKVDGVCKKKF